jgi:hypothetical protein
MTINKVITLLKQPKNVPAADLAPMEPKAARERMRTRSRRDSGDRR